MGLLVALGLPWSTVDLVSSGADLLKSHLPTSLQHAMKLKNIARLQRRSYCHHTKFKHTPPQKWQRNNMKPCQLADVLGGWASLPELLPHVQPLFQCYPNPPIVSVTCAQVFNIMWKEANWERLINKFLFSHDSSHIMNISHFFANQKHSEGVVTVSLQAALISSLEDPYCLSSIFFCSSIITDSGALVCISLHRSDYLTYKSITSSRICPFQIKLLEKGLSVGLCRM
jgi:hypothetical protein